MIFSVRLLTGLMICIPEALLFSMSFAFHGCSSFFLRQGGKTGILGYGLWAGCWYWLVDAIDEVDGLGGNQIKRYE